MKRECSTFSIGFSRTPSGTDPTGIDPCLPVVRCRPCIPDGLTFACIIFVFFTSKIVWGLGLGIGVKFFIIAQRAVGKCKC